MKLLFALLVLASSPCFGAYSFCRAISMNPLLVPSTTLIDYPLTVSGTYSHLATVANGGKVQNASGYDIGYFTSSAATTKLDWERERWVSTTGESIYHIRIPIVNTTFGFLIYQCYGDASITTDQSNRAGTWNSNYKGVWDMSQDPSGSAPQLLDSTSSGFHMTTHGSMASGALVAGKVGSAINFTNPAAPEYASTSVSIGIAGSTSTISMWFNQNNTTFAAGLGGVLEGAFPDDENFLQLDNPGGNKLTGHVKTSGGYNLVTGSTVIGTGVWHHVALVYNGSNVITYLDGVQEATASAPGTLAGDAGFVAAYVASSNSGFAGFDGKLDEIRASSAASSPDWIAAEYNNQNSPSTFYALGAENGATAGRRRQVIIE